MAKPKDKPKDLTFGQTFQEILRLFRERRLASDAQLRRIAAAIRKNTEALSSLSTYPPEAPPPVQKDGTMSTDPGQAVSDALASQTEAIANLSAELADEHQEWLNAVAAGDNGQAEAIVAKVQENTAKLQELSTSLAGSHPGTSGDNVVNPL